MSSRVSDSTLFISIASYEDPLLWWTVDQAVSAAAHPERLRFGIVDQSRAERGPTGAEPPGTPRPAPLAPEVRYTWVDSRYARGPCWARALAYSLSEGEDYLLQIDAHMAFDPGWDDRLVSDFLQLQERLGHDRLILSTYPLGFLLEDGVVRPEFEVEGTLALHVRKDRELSAEHPVLVFEAVGHPTGDALLGYHVGAGCLFAPGRLFAEVPIDPWIYFHGEEQNIAVRAWTHGYDIVHPEAMPIRHLYKREGHRQVVHWTPEEDARRRVRWQSLEARTKARMNALLYEGASLGAYGLGSRRSLRQFEEFSGIFYSRRHVDRARAQAIRPVPAAPARPSFGTLGWQR